MAAGERISLFCLPNAACVGDAAAAPTFGKASRRKRERYREV